MGISRFLEREMRNIIPGMYAIEYAMMNLQVLMGALNGALYSRVLRDVYKEPSVIETVKKLL